ncbi:MAG TPA: peptidylprolyl isomerase [Bacteroidota bacterium]|nr:peptidylprolyl isomerase [Bacteroidota bacterium]
MRRSNLLLALFLLLSPLAPARQLTRGERILDILRLQDARAPFGARLAAYIADTDVAVRRRAALACGSLQDTAALPALVAALAGGDTPAADAAAFAIGQTAGFLPEPGRARLADNLIRRRVNSTRARGRLVEEIGKFCTASSLSLLVSFCGATDTVHTAMAIARCAIRGVTDTAATSYLVGIAREPASAPWQAVYALQRIGDSPGIRNSVKALFPLAHATDPRVRMNLAMLLGKLQGGDESGAVLIPLALRDPDWRVRVSALRAVALCSLTRRAAVDALFARAFGERMVNIAVAALSAFPPAGFTAEDTAGARVAAMLMRMSGNCGGHYPWQLQSEAAAALSRIEHRVPLLRADSGGRRRPELEAALLRAAGTSGDTAAADIIRSCAGSDDPRIVCAALEALGALAHRVGAQAADADSAVACAERALRSRDMAIVSTAAGVLADSLLRRTSSVAPLIAALRNLRAPEDVEAIQDVIDALRSITGRDYSPEAPAAVPRSPADADSTIAGWTGSVVHLRLRTTRGDILIALDEDAAPFTVMSMLRLVRAGFYNGLTFHRVVPNFVVQGGDPRGDGWGGPNYTLRSEFSPERYERGTVGIASAGKDTEGSQFFIAHSPQPHLDGRYTVVGKVLRGMDAVDRIRVADRIIDARLVR